MNTTYLVGTSPLSTHQSISREATILILLHNQNCIIIFSALKSYIRKQQPLLFTYVTGSTKTITKLGWQGQSSHSSIERGRKNFLALFADLIATHAEIQTAFSQKIWCLNVTALQCEIHWKNCSIHGFLWACLFCCDRFYGNVGCIFANFERQQVAPCPQKVQTCNLEIFETRMHSHMNLLGCWKEKRTVGILSANVCPPKHKQLLIGSHNYIHSK